MSFRAVVLDLDGTVYRGQQLIPGVREACATLRAKGIQPLFLTNNSAVSREELADKLTGMGVLAEAKECYGTGPAVAYWAKSNGHLRVGVVGSESLCQSLRRQGLVAEFAEQIGVADLVVTGIDRKFTYERLDAAQQLIFRGAKFVATNRDATYPLEEGRIQPGSGAIVAAIAVATGVQPIVVGKPNPTMIFDLLEEFGLSPAEVVVVGDRVDTDIEAGRRAGCAVQLVLSGVTHEAPERVPASADLLDWVNSLR